MQVPQRVARVEAHLRDEQLTGALEALHGVGPPADPVQHLHQQPDQPLPAGVPEGQVLQLGQDLDVSPGPDLHFQEQLPRRQLLLGQQRPDLVQTADVGQRRTPRQLRRLPQQFGPLVTRLVPGFGDQ